MKKLLLMRYTEQEFEEPKENRVLGKLGEIKGIESLINNPTPKKVILTLKQLKKEIKKIIWKNIKNHLNWRKRTFVLGVALTM